MRLHTRFVLVLSLMALTPLALVGGFAYRSGRAAVEERLGRLFELSAERSLEALEGEATGRSQAAQAWARLELIEEEAASDDLDGRMTSFLLARAREDHTLTSALVLREGRVVAASRPEWVGKGLESLPFPVSSLTEPCGEAPAGPAEPWTLACSWPVAALLDPEVQVARLHVRWDLRVVARDLRLRERGETPGALVLLRRDGVVGETAPAVESLQGVNLGAAGFNILGKAASDRGGFGLETFSGRELLVGHTALSPHGWRSLVVEDAAVAFASVEQLRRAVVGMGLLVGIAAVGMALFLARRISLPVLELKAAAERVATGHLDLHLSRHSDDEVGSLASSFSLMVAQLKEQRAHLVDREFVDSVLDHMADGLFVADSSGRLLRANRALATYVGCSPVELQALDAGWLFTEGEEAFRQKVVEPAQQRSVVREVELTLRTRRRQLIPMSLSAGRISHPDGSGFALVCIATDITERKQTESALREARVQAEAAAEAKAQFLATMSHEIRTPLNGVMGMTDLLLASRLDHEQREFAEVARTSGEALLALLNDVLDFSKMDAGRLELEQIDFDLRVLLEGVMDILAHRAQEKALEMSLMVEPSLPRRVTGDPARLRQVLLNLGSNAIKFTHRGEVVFHAGPEPGRPTEVRFTVSDTGVGIPVDRFERLFKPFSQGDASTTRRYGGTGLGLAICRRIVEAMGGEIGMESVLGRGSTFSFRLALPEAPAPASAGEVEPAHDGLVDRRVLVVDDNVTNRRVLGGMLKAWSCRFEEAGDAWEALDLLRKSAGTKEAFEVAILDFQMPEMDGAQLAAEIRRSPELVGLPLVLLTSMPRTGDAARMQELGFDAYLTKPVKQGVLRDALLSVLTGRKEDRPGLVTVHALSEAARARRRVLVVDDNALNRKVAARAVEKAGFSCDTAAGGEEALTALSRARYDLVFLDCQMPGLDGYETARRIRESEPPGRRTPLVALTGETLESAQSRRAAAGFDDGLTKPARAEDYEAMLKRWARSARAESANPSVRLVVDNVAGWGAGQGRSSSPRDPDRT